MNEGCLSNYLNRVLSGERNSVKNWKINEKFYNKDKVENLYFETLKENSHKFQQLISMENRETNEVYSGKMINFLVENKIKLN